MRRVVLHGQLGTRKPDCLAGRMMCKEWCRRGESNPRPRDYETLALPLSYAGVDEPFMLRIPDYSRQAVRGISRFVVNWSAEESGGRQPPVLNDLVPPYCCSYNDAAPNLCR